MSANQFPTATEMQKLLKEAYDAGVQASNAAAADCARVQKPGTLNIRPAVNGYILTEWRHAGSMVEWAVEGDLTDVGKQIEAIAADRKIRDAMGKADAALMSNGTYARSPITAAEIAAALKPFASGTPLPGVALKP